jgi:hypothetical protein
MKINIRGINKIHLLKSLWNNSQPAAVFGMTGLRPPSFSEKEAKSAVTDFIDYFCGRRIRMDISKNETDPRFYDRDNGADSVSRIVEKLRNNSSE